MIEIEKDSLIPNLQIRTYPSTRRCYFLYYRTKHGQERRPKIGEVGRITLKQARSRARAILDKVSIGEDPSGDWQRVRIEMDVFQLFTKVWDKHWDQPRFQESGHAKEVDGLFSRVIEPTFGEVKISQVTPTMVRDWHEGLRDKPTTANRALEVLSRLFRYADERNLLPRGNPCKGVAAFSEKRRVRYATHEEIAKLGKALEEEAKANPRAVAFIYLLIYSGSRPRAIERAVWSDLATVRDHGILTLAGKSTAKTGEPESVVLPPQAMAVIKKLPRNTDTITGIKMPRKVWNRVKKAAGCPDLWARDWRRTFATMGMSNGVDKAVVGELLNHKSAQTTSRYAKLMMAPRLDAVTRIADKLEKCLKGR